MWRQPGIPQHARGPTRRHELPPQLGETAPSPSFAFANRELSSGESLETKVSIAYTRPALMPIDCASALAPSSPLSSRTDHAKITRWSSFARSIDSSARMSAELPARSSIDRAVNRVPARRAEHL